MFLTRKALNKIRLLSGAYCVMGLLCLLISGMIASFGIKSKFLVILGIICFPLGLFSRITGRYAEGKGPLLNSGNKLCWVCCLFLYGLVEGLYISPTYMWIKKSEHSFHTCSDEHFSFVPINSRLYPLPSPFIKRKRKIRSPPLISTPCIGELLVLVWQTKTGKRKNFKKPRSKAS